MLIKKLLRVSIYLLLISHTTVSVADEGMWLPILLKQLNETDMQAKGLKLTAEDIYSVNKTSLKDAVVQFAGGCTGEIISDKGLLLTNHHCGLSNIRALSSVADNYLRDGYWAKNFEEEMPCPGLVVTFIIRMENVTDKIAPQLDASMTESQRNAKIKELSIELQKAATADTHYDAVVQPFYYGTEFYLFVTENFKDIRFVGAPHASVGNFGGETDNWIYPRHTGDFSLFRIYASAENKPAAYSKDNVPFKPRYSFPISLKGVKEGDFTMVYGFPGRTTEYLSASAVDLLINVQNPNRIKIRDARIEVMNEFMRSSDSVQLMYASKVRSLANAYKKWKGEMIGLKAGDAVEKKQKQETDFQKWTQNTEAGKPYQNLLLNLNQMYDVYKPLTKIADYTNEAALGVEIINYAANFKKLIAFANNDLMPEDSIVAEANKILKNSAGYFKIYYMPLDQKMFAVLLKLYNDSVDLQNQHPYFKNMAKRYNYNFEKWSSDLFKKSFMTSMNDVETVLKNCSRRNAKKIANDPAWQLHDAINSAMGLASTAELIPTTEKIIRLQRDYMIAKQKCNPEKVFYPDANSTLRLTYGLVKPYQPRNGVSYNFATTAEGITEKYIAGDEDFDAPAQLIDLINRKDFGRYVNENGQLPVTFIAANHTTGGNSGSPVINANGELIGTNFDRVWEGTMSDVMYDVNRCRNIAVDIRYTLFIIEKLGGAKNIIDELKFAN